MAQFSYTAKERSGKTVKGTLEANDKSKALTMLRERDLLPLKLEEKKTGSSLFSGLTGEKKAAKVNIDDLVLFTRQLATLVGSGVSIVNAIDTLGEQIEDQAFRSVLIDIRDMIRTGSSLSMAIEKYENIFSPYFVNMVKSGETGGQLEGALERIAEYLEKTSSLQKKVKSAMVYPIVVISMSILVTIVMLTVVVPVFEDMFATFDHALPAPTQFLIDLSDFMSAYFFLLVLGFVGFIYAIKAYLNTSIGHYRFDAFKLKMPIFGQLVKKVSISNFTRTLGTLSKSGVPILTALEIVAKTAGNDVVEKAVYTVKDNVQKGESIASPMEKSGIFPPLVTCMVSVGEKSGQLDKMLDKISDFYDEQVDATVDALTSMIEPLVILVLGLIIGAIAIAMFLPVFQMSQVVGF